MVSEFALKSFLHRHKKIGVDSNLLIYFLEADPQFGPITDTIFSSIKREGNEVICSTLSMLEILVEPHRINDDKRLNKCYSLLTTSPFLSWIYLDIKIADLGASLRAKYRIKTPDAIILATALSEGATGFIGNDQQLRNIKELEVLILGD